MLGNNRLMWREVSNYAMKLHLQQTTAPKLLLGLDLGTQFTGVSVSDCLLKQCYYCTSIQQPISSPLFFEELIKILKKRKPSGVIIGKPNNLKLSSEGKSMETHILDFFQKSKTVPIKGSFNPDHPFLYTTVDESWSTKQARDKLREMGQQYRKYGHLHNEKELVDGMAAIIILRRYIEYLWKQ